MAVLCNKRGSAMLADGGRGAVAADLVDTGQQMVELPDPDAIVEYLRGVVDRPTAARGEWTAGRGMGRSGGLQVEPSGERARRKSQEEQRRAATERRADHDPGRCPAMAEEDG